MKFSSKIVISYERDTIYSIEFITSLIGLGSRKIFFDDRIEEYYASW